MSATVIYGLLLAFFQDKISKKIVEKIKKKDKDTDENAEEKDDKAT